MNPVGWVLAGMLVVALLTCPRDRAPTYLLIGCIILTPNQYVTIAGLNFPVLRILILAGLFRTFIKKEHENRVPVTLDTLVGLWMLWSVLISFFQTFGDGTGPISAAGTVLNVGGVYYLFRIWAPEFKDIRLVVGTLAFILIPLALEMLYECKTGVNLFGYLGGSSTTSLMREGRIRASGSFGHPILAGTVGAVCFPLFVALFKSNRRTAIIGMITSLAITLASRSSGPLMSLIFSLIFLGSWKLRRHYKTIFFSAIAAYIVLNTVMNAPAYHLISRIDLSGGSTGEHRVRLLDAFFDHFSEWWFSGTDYTRHWMTFGLSEKHVDITSYYVAMGINGGLMALLLFIMILFSAIRTAPLFSRGLNFAPDPSSFLVWCIGSGMAAHAATSISVSYFDQSVCFFWMNLALLGTAQAVMKTEHFSELQDN